MDRLDRDLGDGILIVSFFDARVSTYLTLGLSKDGITIQFQEDSSREESEKTAEEYRRDGLTVVTWYRVA